MRIWRTPIALAVLAAALARGAEESAFREQVEADWLLQEKHRAQPPPSAPATTRSDAAGGCDGVRDGTFGFHTGLVSDPWWQVDLGAAHALDRVAIWNRCDGAVERIAHLALLLSEDGAAWRTAYRHDGTIFQGFPDRKPLSVSLAGERARLVRIQLPGTTYLHLDEVEVFGSSAPDVNLALEKPADQASISQWSRPHERPGPIDWRGRLRAVADRSRQLAAELRELGGTALDLAAELAALEAIERAPDPGLPSYLAARWIQRRLLLAHPLLSFDAILFAQRVPGSFNHMSDQHLGWWSRPGGGIFILRGFRSGAPSIECITGAFSEPGSFQRPSLSYDGTRILFSWCKHYPGLANEQNKLDKGNVPEDAFYHIFEMRPDGSGLRRLTRGKYDDFDGHYLPDGSIVFLSTRRGQSVRAGRESAERTLARGDLPDIYVRCGGGPERPCAVYTLHTMDRDGGNLCAISPFEMFEWTPSVANDGTILYSRWDYIDRDNMPYMSLWSINPDGTNARLIYGNFTRSPHCTFEPRSIPGSHKIIFTGSAHHSQTKGSLALLDPSMGTEGALPIARLTPDVAFPEAEGWPAAYYAHPWPLSERLYLVCWGVDGALAPATSNGWDRWHSVAEPANGQGLYLLDAGGSMELLHRDRNLAAADPIPLRPRERPPIRTPSSVAGGEPEGRFLLLDVYQGLRAVPRGAITALRIIAVPPKTHPTMNFPAMGITRDDPGKCVLGTVPVEPDGSAYFRVPAGVIVFFQALDAGGAAVQTMRSATHAQPGQTLSCVGCHEPRSLAPRQAGAMAARREPSGIAIGPEGSWPLRFDRLVQPVLEKHCVACHSPRGDDPRAARFDLTAARAYETLIGYGKPSLAETVAAQYRQGFSAEGAGIARTSALLALLTAPAGHRGVALDRDALERLIVWMDACAQRLGSFSPEQEASLAALRDESTRARTAIER